MSGSRGWASNGEAAGVALLVVVVAVAGATPTDRVLRVTDAETGRVLVAAPVEDGTPVVLTYTHSVERSQVVDAYVVEGTTLVMTRSEFHSYGWGLPATADLERRDGAFVVEPDREYRRIHVKPGRIAGHRLRVGDRRYDLVALSDARTVTLRVERRPAALVLFSALRNALGVQSRPVAGPDPGTWASSGVIAGG